MKNELLNNFSNHFFVRSMKNDAKSKANEKKGSAKSKKPESFLSSKIFFLQISKRAKKMIFFLFPKIWPQF
jgi:hypothetical protein